MATKIESITTARGEIDFGSVDTKGRRVGVIWLVEWNDEKHHTAAPEYGIPECTQPAGYYVRVSIARDGQRFGAYQEAAPTESIDAAFAEIARKARGAYKRWMRAGNVNRRRAS